MTKLWTAFAAMLVAGVAASSRPAQAAPPTVTPSPGYDARLQEQRKAASSSEVVRPAVPVTTNVTHHRSKPRH